MNLDEIGRFLFAQPLLALAVLAILLAAAGWIAERSHPRSAQALRLLGYTGMVAALLLVMVEATWHASRSDARLLLGSVGKVTVVGRETVVPLDPSGHYWVKAELNGQPAEFLIDTGATYTALAPATARAAGIVAESGRLPVQLDTANGPIVARFGKARELTFGTIFARDFDVVIGPEEAGETNVIGMDLLSRLKGWRVENKALVLVPEG
ncbi:MAG: TIGR02281 family clan AA aspartic protease [Novosphingobium sp.]